MRFGERMGERAMYDRAKRMEAAFEKARDAARSTPAEGGAREEPAEWAKLDMAEFREIEGYGGVKDIISTKLRSHSVDSAWFEDPGSGKEYLLFRVSDVEEVCRSFDELSKEAGNARRRHLEARRPDRAAHLGPQLEGAPDGRAPQDEAGQPPALDGRGDRHGQRVDPSHDGGLDARDASVLEQHEDLLSSLGRGRGA